MDSIRTVDITKTVDTIRMVDTTGMVITSTGDLTDDTTQRAKTMKASQTPGKEEKTVMSHRSMTTGMEAIIEVAEAVVTGALTGDTLAVTTRTVRARRVKMAKQMSRATTRRGVEAMVVADMKDAAEEEEATVTVLSIGTILLSKIQKMILRW